MNEIKKNVEAAKKTVEISKKMDVEKRRNKRLKGYLDGDVRNGRDTGKSRSDLKDSNKRIEHLDRERQRAEKGIK